MSEQPQQPQATEQQPLFGIEKVYLKDLSLELPNAPGCGFGLGFSVLVDPARAGSPESPGTWRWGGAYGHSWFVDPARQLSVVALTNTLYEGMSGTFVVDLRDAVYASLRGVPEDKVVGRAFAVVPDLF